MRFTILALALLISLSMVSGYTLVHYEDFGNYSCVGSACSAYDFRNLTSGGAGLNGMSVGSGVASFSNAASFVGVSHSFNIKGGNYCINPCGNNTCTTPANFSMRVDVRQTGASVYDTDDYFHFGLWTGLAYQPQNNVRYTMNVSGAGGQSRWYYVHDGGILVTATTHPQDTNFRTIQFDFIMEQDTSPVVNQQVKGAVVWVDGLDKAEASMVFPVSSACFNTTWFRFRNDGAQDYEIDNLYVVQYLEGEPFINANDTINISSPPTPPTYVQCNDSNDNDGDGFIDSADPSCTFVGDDDESPQDIYDCNDGLDNDNDNFIDYPSDASCSDLYDDDESPFDYTQCNDGLDNDNDGLIDYPNDPSCTSYSDTSENQTDYSTQTEDFCIFSQGCVFYDSFPYSDSIYLHNWYDSTSDELPNTYYIQGGNALKLITRAQDNLTYNFQIYKQFNNPASTLDEVILDFKMFFVDELCPDLSCGTNQSFYFILDGSGGNTTMALKFEILTDTDDIRMYYVNSDGSLTYLTTYDILFTPTQDINPIFTLDLLSNTTSFGGATYPFYRNSTPTGVRITDISYDSGDVSAYFGYIKVLYPITTAVCTDFSPPYYLREDFNSGDLKDCGWTTTPSPLVVSGSLKPTNDITFVSAAKGFYDSSASTYVSLTNQYSTFTFDVIPYSASSSPTLFTFGIWDTSGVLTSFIFKRDGTIISPVASGTLANLNLNQQNTFKLITNLFQDTYDLYVNGVQVMAGESFDAYSKDALDMVSIYFQSASSSYAIDNISIYTSDAEGNPILTLDTSLKSINNETFWNGLYYLNAPPCTQDSDCLTGVCSPSNTCSRFDFRTCAKYGMDKDGYCVISNMTRYAFLWIADVILDNFLLFIMFLIIMMIVVYLAIMFRNNSRGG